MKTFCLYDDVYNESLISFDTFMHGVDEKEDIELVIMSYGGSIFDGIAIADRIIEAPNRFTARILGCAMSAAAVIACACDRIVMSELDAMMIHTARNCFGEVDEGSHVANESILKIVHRRLPDYTEKDLMKDRFYTAKEALDAGLADEIIGVDAERTELVARWAAHLRSEGGKIMNEEEKKEEKQEEIEVAEDIDPVAGLIAAIEDLQARVSALEEKMAAGGIEAEGGEDEEKKEDIIAASLRKIYANIGNVCKPVCKEVAKTTPESEKARLEGLYGDFSRFNER